MDVAAGVMRDRSELSPAESIAWDRCDREHGWDDPCDDCKVLITRINNVIKAEVALAIQERQDRIQLALDNGLAAVHSKIYRVMHYGEDAV